MADYGFKISTFEIGPSRGAFQPIELQSPLLHGDGCMGLLANLLDGLPQGKVSRDSNYVRILSYDRLRHGLLLKVRGGPLGDRRDIVQISSDVTRDTVTSDDALTWDSRILFALLPDALQGVIVSETWGNSHHGILLNEVIQTRLRELDKLRMSVTHDVADGVAWKKILAAKDAYVQRLEFRQINPAQDGTQFTSESEVSHVAIEYGLSKTGRVQKGVVDALTSDENRHSKKLMEIVGGTRYSDEEFDEQVATIVTGKRPRKYRIDRRQPWFNYHIESPAQLDDPEFLSEVQPDVLATLSEFGIDVPPGWMDKI